MDDDLKLPMIKIQDDRPLFSRRSIPIEELLNFMEFNLKHTVDIEAVRKNKRKLSVLVPFRLL